MEVYELVFAYEGIGTNKIIFKNKGEEVSKIDETTPSVDEVLYQDVVLDDKFHTRKLGNCKVKSFSFTRKSLIININTNLRYY